MGLHCQSAMAPDTSLPERTVESVFSVPELCGSDKRLSEHTLVLPKHPFRMTERSPPLPEHCGSRGFMAGSDYRSHVIGVLERCGEASTAGAHIVTARASVFTVGAQFSIAGALWLQRLHCRSALPERVVSLPERAIIMSECSGSVKALPERSSLLPERIGSKDYIAGVDYRSV
ncbi:hypothetical protein AMTR_s00091p00059590 [Amborella trichopoda]|uniref:Uncharacterized protein n=1 Tax=Amborella trichopoda TaxID=13333 RepID=W1NYZ6_AMBTC|nr:hypothetical protein AMTR_s00091p00059590 [Amborella trichopoda]